MKISAKDVERAQVAADQTGLNRGYGVWLDTYNRELGIEVVEPLAAGEYIRGNDELYLVDRWGNTWQWQRELGAVSLGSSEIIPRDGLSEARIGPVKRVPSWEAIRQTLRIGQYGLKTFEYDNMADAVWNFLKEGALDE